MHITDSNRKNYTQLFNTTLCLVMGEKPFSDFPFAIRMQMRNGVKFDPGKNDKHSCAIFVHFLVEAIRNTSIKLLVPVRFETLLLFLLY